MKLPPFEYLCPQSLDEALAVLASHAETARPLAGGQTLLPIMAFRLAEPALLIDLRRIPELSGITIGVHEVRIGAMVSWRDIEESDALRAACPILANAMAHVAHYQIRNRGTVGGSLAHGDPASEMPGLAVLCDAVIDIAGTRGRRHVRAAEFYLAPLTTVLEADELIEGIRLRRWPRQRRWAFDEFAIRRGDFALAGIGLCYDLDDRGNPSDARIAVIGATDVPRRLSDAENMLNGKPLDNATIMAAAEAAARQCNPPEHFQASIAYRRALVRTLVERLLLSTIDSKAGAA
jgi:carbon-monoxide dehydrogenase medium subunit